MLSFAGSSYCLCKFTPSKPPTADEDFSCVDFSSGPVGFVFASALAAFLFLVAPPSYFLFRPFSFGDYEACMRPSER